MSEYQLTNIKINKLFGEKSYDIYLEDNKLVFFAENGSGKTTILNIVAAFLSKEWYRLYSYPFESIECRINNRSFTFIRNNAIIYNTKNYKEYVQTEGKANATKNIVLSILEINNLEDLVKNNFSEKSILIPTKQKTSLFTIGESFIEGDNIIAGGEEDDEKLNSIIFYLKTEYKNYIESNYKNGTNYTELTFYPILFLPTYRVIEREVNLLLDVDIENKSKSIHNEYIDEVFEFGMGSVTNIFDRVIPSILQSKKEKLDQFIEICNNYIKETKELIFDEVRNELRIKSKKTFILFENLSSGEKQILTIFAYLLLLNKDFFVIIDEPEISLSLLWQKQILIDIMNNSKGFFAATHSPFVSEDGILNSFQDYLYRLEVQ